MMTSLLIRVSSIDVLLELIAFCSAARPHYKVILQLLSPHDVESNLQVKGGQLEAVFKCAKGGKMYRICVIYGSSVFFSKIK